MTASPDIPDHVAEELDSAFGTQYFVETKAAASILDIPPRTLLHLGDRGVIHYRPKGSQRRLYTRQHLENFIILVGAPDGDAEDLEEVRVGHIYFVRCCDFIKIGFTTDVDRRIRTIRSHNPHPIELLHTIAGTTAREKSLHTQFAAYRTTGEWFRLEQPILDFIEAKKNE